MSEFDPIEVEGLDPELLDKYGVLIRNLQNYFPTADDLEDRSAEFIREYRLQGESNIRFDGIEEQLKLSIKRHVEFTQVLNASMGYELTPNQTSEYMIDLYNRLTGTDETQIRAKGDPNALMDYYAGRGLNLPFNVPYFGKTIPLWFVFILSAIVAGLGWLGTSFLKFPVIEQLSLLVLIVGVVGILYSAATMYFLRDEVVNAEKYADRNAALQQWRAAKQQKRETSRWRLPSIRR